METTLEAYANLTMLLVAIWGAVSSSSTGITTGSVAQPLVCCKCSTCIGAKPVLVQWVVLMESWAWPMAGDLD